MKIFEDENLAISARDKSDQAGPEAVDREIDILRSRGGLRQNPANLRIFEDEKSAIAAREMSSQVGREAVDREIDILRRLGYRSLILSGDELWRALGLKSAKMLRDRHYAGHLPFVGIKKGERGYSAHIEDVALYCAQARAADSDRFARWQAESTEAANH